MKILLVDYAHESDRDFNLPTQEKLGRSRQNVETMAGTGYTFHFYPAGVRGAGDRRRAEQPVALPFRGWRARRHVGLPRRAHTGAGHLPGPPDPLGHDFGAELIVGIESEHGPVTVSTSPEGADDRLFRGLPEEFPVEAMHYGSIAVPEGFTHLAESDGCVNQAHVGPNGLLYGVQFHPERSGEVGDAIFENFARMAYDLESQPMAA